VKVLVTGASGFVGGRLIQRLRRDLDGAHRIIGWDHVPAQQTPTIAGLELRVVDLTDAAAVEAAVRADRPQRVFHLAALSSVKQAEGAARRTYDVNVNGTGSLARALRAHAPGAVVVFASSGEIYGSVYASGEAVTETAAVGPLNAYARSKLAAEILLQDVLSDACPVIALRLLNHSGPGQDERFVVPSFAARIARIEKGLSPPSLEVGNLEARRDFLDIDDVIEAYMETLRLADSANGFQVYNIASGRPRSIGSILDRLIGLAKVKPTVLQAPELMRPGEIASTLCDASAFRARTGWQPTRDFDDTTAAILDWWRAHVA
jgi:GDP-4-dehydro-6-deoxy-D-mannose reductase